MNKDSKIVKVAMSTKVRPRVSRRSSKLFHYFASLKTLRSLKALKAVMTLPLSD